MTQPLDGRELYQALLRLGWFGTPKRTKACI